MDYGFLEIGISHVAKKLFLYTTGYFAREEEILLGSEKNGKILA